MNEPTKDNEALRLAIVDFYRDQIAARYQLENIRRFPQFEHVTDAQAIALRDYFLHRIYPPTSERENLDEALQRLRDVLTSPKRVRPFMTAGLKSMWKLGAALPAAVKAGTNVMDTYLVARKIEDEMVVAAIELDISEHSSREEMLEIIRHLPEADIMKLVRDLMLLFRVLTNTKVLGVAIEFLGTCTAIMKSKPELYSEDDLAGIALGTDLVQGGRELFEQIDSAYFDTIIDGIEAIELEWYRNIMAGTRPTT